MLKFCLFFRSVLNTPAPEKLGIQSEKQHNSLVSGLENLDI